LLAEGLPKRAGVMASMFTYWLDLFYLLSLVCRNNGRPEMTAARVSEPTALLLLSRRPASTGPRRPPQLAREIVFRPFLLASPRGPLYIVF